MNSNDPKDKWMAVDPTRRSKTFTRARERGAILADDILARADMVTGDELTAKFNISREMIDERFRSGQLLGLSTPKHGRKYPALQFDRDGQVLTGVAQVIAYFNGDGWSAWRFLSTTHIELEYRTGFEALKHGNVDDVTNLLVAISHGAFS